MRTNNSFSIITVIAFIFLTAIAIMLPFAIIGLVGYVIYKFVIWNNRKKRLPEINKRYSLFFDLRDRCKSNTDFFIENGNKEFRKDYQKIYNTLMYNDNYWSNLIEQKEDKEFYEMYNGLNNAITYQVERLNNNLLLNN
ncbi:MAG: hypothetical protein KDD23_03325 [Winogradskyella sp.]|nr:hypothetical protein [Winogradskyella sp.]